MSQALLSLVQGFNQTATEGRDWLYQVMHQVDGQGVTTGLKTTFLKPYFNQHGKEVFNKSDGYTVHLPSLRVSYHDKRTEFLFKQNDNQLERTLEQLLSKI